MLKVLIVMNLVCKVLSFESDYNSQPFMILEMLKVLPEAKSDLWAAAGAPL